MVQARPNDTRGLHASRRGLLRLNGDNGDLSSFRRADSRAFFHKSFIGRAIGGVVKRAIPAVGIAESLIRTVVPKRPARRTLPREVTARPTVRGSQQKARAREFKFGGPAPFEPVSFAPGTPCTSPAVRDPDTGLCVTPKPGVRGAIERLLPGGSTGFEPTPRAPVGNAVMGRYGAALEPGVQMIQRSVCLPGMQLGNDGLCYNKGAITNKQRQWPRGRAPLLTGGDMAAISRAARAGAKLDRTTKRLRILGMMKRLPAPRKAAAHKHAQPVAAVSV